MLQKRDCARKHLSKALCTVLPLQQLGQNLMLIDFLRQICDGILFKGEIFRGTKGSLWEMNYPLYL